MANGGLYQDANGDFYDENAERAWRAFSADATKEVIDRQHDERLARQSGACVEHLVIDCEACTPAS